MKAGFLEKLIGRLGKIDPSDVQNYFLRLAQEKGFLETVFNAVQEGIIVTDSGGRITYLNDAACELFGLDGTDAIGKQLDERVRGLDWHSFTGSGGQGAFSADEEGALSGRGMNPKCLVEIFEAARGDNFRSFIKIKYFH